MLSMVFCHHCSFAGIMAGVVRIFAGFAGFAGSWIAFYVRAKVSF